MAAQQPVKKISTHISSAAERKNEEGTFPALTSRRSSTNGDKGASRVPIKIAVTSIGSNIKDDVPTNAKGQMSQPLTRHLSKTMSKLPERDSSSSQLKKKLSRRVTGRDRSAKYWTWLEDTEADSLDGLTDDVKEKLKVAAAAHRLAEAMEDETAEHTEERIQTRLKRITSEILDYEKAVNLEERACSEPSIIVPDEDILVRVKIWHPSGPAKILKTILKPPNSQAIKPVEPKLKSKLTFVPRCQLKSSKSAKVPLQKSLTDLKPAPLTTKVSIVNMSFQSPKL